MQPRTNPQSPVRICLGVCTYRRPKMLMQCLKSLQQVYAPKGTQLVIVVVDNEPSEEIRALVNSFTYLSGQTPIIYVREHRRGIAQARNAILDVAETQGAHWIAMVDDDMRVPPHWLADMWFGVSVGAAVVESSVEYELPKPLPRWAFPKTKRKQRGLLSRTHAGTCGVLFKAGMIDSQGVPLRFSEDYALTGGEDRDFFRRAWKAGHKIIKTPDAVATEIVPASKLTYSAQVYRAYWIEVVNARQDLRDMNCLYVLGDKSLKASGCFFSACFNLLAAPVAAFNGAERARKHLLKAGKQLYKARGIAVGLAGIRHPEPYLTVHGE